MNIHIIGLQRKALQEYIQQTYPALSFASEKPDIVLCYGGDGTLLYAEREYPGIPKLVIRNSQVCSACAELTRDTVLRLLVEEQFHIQEYTTLQAESKGQQLRALNEIVIGRPRVNGTVRLKVSIDGEQYGDEIYGDGVIVSTPFGSTGYYQSITKSNFFFDIGVAFNNAINYLSHVVVSEEAQVKVEISRGPGLIAADNGDDEVSLSTGDVAFISVSQQKARIVEFSPEYARFHIRTHSRRIPWGCCQICGNPL